MKLKNKKTGEIIECAVIPIIDGYVNEYETFKKGETLAELNEEWEDYEEPKRYWAIDSVGGVFDVSERALATAIEGASEIGNYFETKEEAKKAVEKLKAWQRLKDTYHIRFALDFIKNNISFTYRIDDASHSVLDEEHIVYEDMKTILGGEK